MNNEKDEKLNDEVRGALSRYSRIITRSFKYYNDTIRNLKKIDADEKESFKIFEGEYTKYITFGFLSLLALLFDFWISSKTMSPLSNVTKLPTEAVAILFSLIDALIAIFASGILANSLVRIDNHRRTGGIFLWTLCAVKIVLFVFFVMFYEPGDVDIMSILILVGLVILVYAILHNSGAGLLYILSRVKFWILRTWQADPESLKLQNKKAWADLENACDKYNVSLNSAIKSLNINDMKIH